jgi:hypothetical protein
MDSSDKTVSRLWRAIPSWFGALNDILGREPFVGRAPRSRQGPEVVGPSGDPGAFPCDQDAKGRRAQGRTRRRPRGGETWHESLIGRGCHVFSNWATSASDALKLDVRLWRKGLGPAWPATPSWDGGVCRCARVSEFEARRKGITVYHREGIPA